MSNNFQKTKIGTFPKEWEIISLNANLNLMTDYVANGSFESLRKNVTVFDQKNFAYYVRLYDLRKGLGHSAQKYINDFSFKFLRKSALKPNDILIANIGANVGETYLMPSIDYPSSLAPNMILLRCNEKTDPRFLLYFLQSQVGKKSISNAIAGSGQPKINKTDLKKIISILPTLPEQKEIAEIISGINRLINQTELEIRKLDEFKTAVSNSLFRKHFKLMEFGSIINIISGKAFQAKDYTNSGIKLLRIDNVHWGKIIWDSIAFLPQEFIKNESKLILKNGDILLALNRPITQGKLKIARCSKQDVPSILYQRVGKIYSKNESQITNSFIYYLMQEFLPVFIENKSVGSDQPFINLTSLRKLKLPVPELKEQKIIVNTLKSINIFREKKLEKLSKLRFLALGMSNDLIIGHKRGKRLIMSQPEFLYVEKPAIDQLQKSGWSYLDGRELNPENSGVRSSLKEVILTPNLEQSIKRINPWISDENLRKIVRDITVIQTSTLMESNQWFWERITQYFSVDQDLGKGRRGQTVKLIDFENIQNNEFLCVNQFKVKGPIQNIIPDIILFVNGLPLGVIECKSPYVTDPMEAGINQLLRYANLRNSENNEGCQKLFHYNQLMISTHRDGARVGTISSPYEYYLEWKDPYPTKKEELGDNTYSQQILIEGLLKPQKFLDIIQNFIIFEVEEGRTIKKIARYQQFRAVQKTISRLKAPGDRKQKGGVIWHTQGSGKSLTMVFLTQKIRRDPLLSDYKLVFLTDRTQLDKQLTNTFRGAQGETVLNAKSVSELKELLRKDSSDLVTSTIQKLEEDDLDFSCLNDSDRIIVLTDEAHRTQYGTLGAAINTALPNAPKIAFTGTPLISSQKTVNEFGAYIDQYTIEQAVADGATLQILYEGREAITKVTGDSLDALFERYFKDKTPEEKNAIKKKYGTQRAVLEAPKRIEWVALDLVEHYREKIMPNGFKVMIVTSSREAAVTYKKKLDEIPDAPDSAVIISGDHNDPPEMMKWTNKTEHQKAIENFKKPLSESSLSILIVKDMLLTGFDAPICQVMYLDRKLTDHSLLQAIARVNRTKAKKFIGYIVDYYGLTDYLKEALEVFSATDVKGALRNLTDEIPKLEATHTRVVNHFKDVDISDLEKCISLLKDDLKRQQFEIDFRSFSKQMEVVLPDKAASPFIKDLKSLGKIAIGARRRYRDDGLNILGAGEKVKKLIEDHVFASGIDPRVPPTKLFDESFLKTLGDIKGDEVKASEIEHAIKAHIKLKLEDDPEYYQSLSLRLNEIIGNYEDKWDELVRQLLLFRDGLEKEKGQKANDLGLNETEFAFYNILMAEIVKSSGEETFSDEIHQRILSLVKKLVNQFEESSKIVGFFLKQDEIKTMQRNIKRAMIEDEFDDPDLRKIVIERFMELAKVKFK